MDTTQVYTSLQLRRTLSAKQAVSPDIYVSLMCQDSIKKDRYNEYMDFIIDQDYIFEDSVSTSDFIDIYHQFKLLNPKPNIDKCEEEQNDFLSFLSQLFWVSRATYSTGSMDKIINQAISIFQNGEYEKILSESTL
jgi:hypothetical protein